MATYINGVTDYIPQIQTFQPDLNFYGNVMQTKQGRYDSAKKKVSDLYGSLLYAPLTGDNNIKRRDEFFNFVDNDIRRISGLDLSLQENQDAAMDVFKGFYDDKDMVNDMVWTRAHNSAVEKHEALKSCIDPAKCGGSAWNDAYEELMYKREDFKNASDAARLQMASPTYTPYFNWQALAEKAARDKGYKVTKQTPTGDYMVTTQNGDLLSGGLYAVFKEVYGSDPRVETNIMTEAYVHRKRTVKNDVSLYGSEEKSNLAYLTKTVNDGLKSDSKTLDKVTSDYNSTDKRIAQLEKDNASKGLTKKDQLELEKAYEQRDILESTKDYLNVRINAVKANAESGDIKILESRADNARASLLLESKLKQTAKAIADTHDVIIAKYEEAPYVAIKKNLEADLVRYKWQRKYNVEAAAQKHEYDKELEYIKQGKTKPGSQPSPEDFILTVGPGGASSELNVKDHPEIGYQASFDEWLGREQEAQAKAGDFNYIAFKTAKQQSTDTTYLNDMYGKGKWENVNSLEDYQAMMKENKKNNNAIFRKTMDYFKVKTNNIQWGLDLMSTGSNAAAITDIKAAQKAANGTYAHNMAVSDKIAENMKKKEVVNSLYRYVDYMFHGTSAHRGSFITNGGKAPEKFKTIYKREHSRASDADVEKAYKFLHEDYFNGPNGYNAAATKDVSFSTGTTLGGDGVMTGPQMNGIGIDPSERGRNSMNMYTRDLLTKVGVDEGNSWVGIGPNTKGTLENAISNEAENKILKNLIAEFRHTIDASGDIANKDEKKQFYDVSATNVAGEKAGIANLQLKFPQKFIVDRAGKDKMIPPALAAKLYNNPVNIFYDKSKIKSKFVERATDKPIQRTLLSDGYFEIDAYQGLATSEPIQILYDKEDNTTTYKGVIQKRLLDGSYKYYNYTRASTGIDAANDQYKAIISDLESFKRLNQATEEQERELNKNKNK